MTNKECVDRWAEHIIPAVFKAEDALQKAKEYCAEIALIIVKCGSDYVPDGTLDE